MQAGHCTERLALPTSRRAAPQTCPPQPPCSPPRLQEGAVQRAAVPGMQLVVQAGGCALLRGTGAALAGLLWIREREQSDQALRCAHRHPPKAHPITPAGTPPAPWPGWEAPGRLPGLR